MPNSYWVTWLERVIDSCGHCRCVWLCTHVYRHMCVWCVLGNYLYGGTGGAALSILDMKREKSKMNSYYQHHFHIKIQGTIRKSGVNDGQMLNLLWQIKPAYFISRASAKKRKQHCCQRLLHQPMAFNLNNLTKFEALHMKNHLN